MTESSHVPVHPDGGGDGGIGAGGALCAAAGGTVLAATVRKAAAAVAKAAAMPPRSWRLARIAGAQRVAVGRAFSVALSARARLSVLA